MGTELLSSNGEALSRLDRLLNHPSPTRFGVTGASIVSGKFHSLTFYLLLLLIPGLDL